MPGRAARTLLRIVLGLAIVAVLAVALIPQLVRTDSGRHFIERFLSRRSGYDVAIEDVEVGYDLSVWASGISVRAPSTEPFFVAEKARLTLRPSLSATGFKVRAETLSPHLYVDRFVTSPSAPKEESRPEKTPHPLDDLWLPPLDVEIRDGFVHQAERELGPVDMRFAPEPDSGVSRLEATIRTGSADNTLQWVVHPDLTERRATLQGEGKIRDVPALLRAAALEAGEPLAGKAELSLKGEIVWDVAGGGSASGRMSISSVEGHDEDSSRALQAVKADVSFEASVGPGKEPRAQIELSIGSGAMLWDAFYLDLAEHALKARLKGRSDGRAMRIDEANVTVAGIATAEGSGTYDPKGARRLDARIEVADLAPLYEVAVREPFRELYPSLGVATVEGRLRARVSYSGAAKPRVTGRVEILGGHVDSRSPEIRVRELELNVPFQIHPAKSDAKREQGFVRAGEVLLGGIPLDDLRLDLVAEPDTVELAQPVRLAVFDGAIELSHLSAAQLGEPGRNVKLGVFLHALDLRGLSQALGGPPLSGTVSGGIPEIAIGDGRIESEGQIDIQAFDGAIAVKDLRVDQILSSVPELSLDAGFEEISLGRLTQELEVGKVTGVVRGAVEDLVMVRSEPVRFDAWMETVSKSGVSQKISVTALRQLSIIGGSDSDPISRGVLSFFDEYGYAKMGLKCSLRNDRFTLHGVESTDGKEYLVVGSRLPPSVNVVSHTQVISFSEMVRRLSRAAAAGKSSPTSAGDAEGSVQ